MELAQYWAVTTRPLLAWHAIDREYWLAVRDAGFMARISPIHHFDWVTAAVQIHQGTADDVTPARWAEAIRDGMQREGVDVEYYAYEGEGHAFRDASWATFMERVAAFFDEYVKGRPAP